MADEEQSNHERALTLGGIPLDGSVATDGLGRRLWRSGEGVAVQYPANFWERASCEACCDGWGCAKHGDPSG